MQKSFSRQTIVSKRGARFSLPDILKKYNAESFFLVRDGSFDCLPMKEVIEKTKLPFSVFSGFASNPLREQIDAGISAFNSVKSGAIVAVGGGSAIDTAKCIRLYSGAKNTPLIAIPTTAGTGSESTRFAVIYENGKKLSVEDDSILPDCALLDPDMLSSLPPFQKKCTMLDAFCQSVESFFSVNSTEYSRSLSLSALVDINGNYEKYLESDPTAGEIMMSAANRAGQAINIAKTTAAHAMSYKLSSLYSLPHGYAAALCLPGVWRYMLDNADKCIDSRGESYLKTVFSSLTAALGQNSDYDCLVYIEKLLASLNMTAPVLKSESDLEILVSSVNPERLRNNPVFLSHDALLSIYKNVFSHK